MLLPRFERGPLGVGEVLFEAGEPILHCYFPLRGMVSLTVSMYDGSTAEVGIAGREGFVGVPVVLGDGWSLHRAFVQVPGETLRVRADDLRKMAREHEPLRTLLLRHASGVLAIAAQAAACNALHGVEARLARWLLIARDRIGSDDLPLTHEFLGLMLGATRPTVTLAMGTFERSGLVETRRGHVCLLDSTRLEQIACECYARMREAVERVYA